MATNFCHHTYPASVLMTPIQTLVSGNVQVGGTLDRLSVEFVNLHHVHQVLSTKVAKEWRS